MIKDRTWKEAELKLVRKLKKFKRLRDMKWADSSADSYLEYVKDKKLYTNRVKAIWEQLKEIRRLAKGNPLSADFFSNGKYGMRGTEYEPIDFGMLNLESITKEQAITNLRSADSSFATFYKDDTTL